jgi:hypothetical protein
MERRDGPDGLMRLFAAIGQRYLAVEQFRACTELLRQELDVEPEGGNGMTFFRMS